MELRPKVSVFMITYNHERFIAQAIESALMQKTSFPFEIVIGEDFSSDGTREIVLDYAARYPEKIRLFLRPQKVKPAPPGLGAIDNVVATYRACRGEYIAFLEGDDYWTDESKLERQVAFLDNHQNCTACYHLVTVVYEDNSPTHIFSLKNKEISGLKELLSVDGTGMKTCGVMIRNHVIKRFPNWFYSVSCSDYAMWIMLAGNGEIGFLSDCMAAYRRHAGGMSIVNENNPKLTLNRDLLLFQGADQYFNYRYHWLLSKNIGRVWLNKASYARREGRYRRAVVYMMRYFRNSPKEAMLFVFRKSLRVLQTQLESRG